MVRPRCLVEILRAQKNFHTRGMLQLSQAVIVYDAPVAHGTCLNILFVILLLASAGRSFLFLCSVNATSAFDLSDVCTFVDIFSVATFSCLICSGVAADILFLALRFAEDGLWKFSLFDVSRFSEAFDG